jgi:hypothetical protein
LTLLKISRLNLVIDPNPPVICGILATASVPKRPCLCFVMVTVVTIAPPTGWLKKAWINIVVFPPDSPQLKTRTFELTLIGFCSSN